MVADPEEPLVSDLAADLEARLAADTRPAFVREDLKLCSCSLSDAALCRCALRGEHEELPAKREARPRSRGLVLGGALP